MSNGIPTKKQTEIAQTELAKGIGTKTDAGKIEPHLIPDLVYHQWTERLLNPTSSQLDLSMWVEAMTAKMKDDTHCNLEILELDRIYTWLLISLKQCFPLSPQLDMYKVKEDIFALKTMLVTYYYIQINPYWKVSFNYASFINALGKAREDEIGVYTFGKYKYSAENWKKVVPPIRYYDACGRHLLHLMSESQGSGEMVIDKDSGFPTIAHMQCDLSFFYALIDYNNIEVFNGYDEWVARERESRKNH